MGVDDEFATLCRRLKASDRRAFEVVFRRLYDRIFRYVRSIAGAHDAACDITQDVFVRLWDARAQLDPEQSLEAYVYRIARNRAYNHQRNRRARTEKRAAVQALAVASVPGTPLPDAQVDAEALEASLRTWIAALPERQREAFVLSRYHGMSHEDIAQVMAISPNTVNNHIVSALKAIRARIRAFEPSLLDR